MTSPMAKLSAVGAKQVGHNNYDSYGSNAVTNAAHDFIGGSAFCLAERQVSHSNHDSNGNNTVTV